jgi:hypothetical protein
MAKNVPFTTVQTETAFAYLAGIIDGEGCFYFGCVKQGRYGNGTQWHCKVAVTSCDQCLTNWLNNLFGGCKEQRYRYTSKRAYERPIYRWDATGELLDYILPKILPYLVIKKEHCQIMMEIRKTYANIGSKRLPQDVVQVRTKLLQKLRKLNSRFHNHALKQPEVLPPCHPVGLPCQSVSI